jgi:hypothetical protein
MIDPDKITNFERSMPELEEFMLFAIMVAGKTAKTTAKKLEAFLDRRQVYGATDFSPLQFVNYLERDRTLLIQELEEVKVGQYVRIARAFSGVLQFFGPKLRTVSVQELESVHGIGPKTARFFVLHSRAGENYAVLDTHVMHWLKEFCMFRCPYDVPPDINSYKKVEKIFLHVANVLGKTPAGLDLEVWTNRANSDELRRIAEPYVVSQPHYNNVLEKFSNLFTNDLRTA